MLLEPGDLFPVGGAGIALCRGTGVQRDRSGSFGLSDAAGIQMCVVGVIDANAKLDRHRYIGAFGGAHSRGHDLTE
ncbi:Uncharacterised protein [Mycobacterium tuberculosis]|uniref:Uncharacterized protein n=1 Tax=Mycobacterium tuberculosis TaxID=1773 RepID=A0A655DKR1_MYCTX|nr:Uncharacterised protein [Mycobacterium tuberculosis]CKR54931.1 Uncharacterised protein [Mycobacterium tuberculosis]CKS64149.1 Uncharacterised protein [Mycobacterium tuberculosis]CKU71965.1 Uncharacterised protein [Mycobacterium tuberculosis]CNU24806.1 Uncharacterised protein [Mycobacterium tuberculosis]